MLNDSCSVQYLLSPVANTALLTSPAKTIVNTNNNTLAKSIADTSTNTAFEKYCQYFCDNIFYFNFYSDFTFNFLHSATSIFSRSSTNNCYWENGKIAIFYSDMMLMRKHCSSIYFRCKTTALVFLLFQSQ